MDTKDTKRDYLINKAKENGLKHYSGTIPDDKKPSLKLVMIAEQGFDLLASGRDYAGPTPQNLNNMLAAEKAMNLAKSKGMSL